MELKPVSTLIWFSEERSENRSVMEGFVGLYLHLDSKEEEDLDRPIME